MTNEKRHSPLLFSAVLLLLQLGILALGALPNAVMSASATAPDEWITVTCSYYSLYPIGAGAYFAPAFSILFAVLSAGWCTVCLIRRRSVLETRWIWVAAFDLTICVLSFSSLWRYGPAYLTPSTDGIAARSLAAFFFLILAQRRSAKRRKAEEDLPQ